MSSGGTLTATVVAPATPSPAPAPRRKAVTENWDDDFEFSLPPMPKTPARPPTTSKHGLGLGLGDTSRDNTFPKPLDSPDSFGDDWDDPVSGPSRSTPVLPPSGTSTALPSRSNSRTNGRQAALLQLPRSSQSHSPTLPSPSSTGGSRRTPLAPSSSTVSNLRVAIGDGSSGSSPVKTLSKRSSTSFTIKSESGDLSLHGASPAHKSSPNLVDPSRRSKRVSMPSRPQSPTKGVLKMPTQPSPAKGGASPAKEPQLRSSPSTENLKKPKFWKRLSAGPTGSNGRYLHSRVHPTPSTSAHKSVATPPRRPRSASFGNLSTPSTPLDAPPVPPLPPNLRSPSVGSSSAISAMSSSPSSTTKAGPVKRLSAMLRRSSSNLSAALKQSSPSPPPLPRPPHPYTLNDGHQSTASVAVPVAASSSSVIATMGTPSAKVFSGGLRHSASRQSLVPSTSSPSGATTPRRPSPIKVATPADAPPPPRTFSPGFHLPNTVAGSPYRAMAPQASPLSRGNAPSGSDTETEEDGSTTPKRRRRVRPVSAQPALRAADGKLAGARFKEVDASVPVFALDHHQVRPKPVCIPSTSSISTQQSFGTAIDPTSPSATSSSHASMSSNGFGHTTLRRITSFSKKHGRRLSGGWKFGSTSSASSFESEVAIIQQAQVVHRLEPVAGSPSKLPVLDKDVPHNLSTASIDIGSPTTIVHPPIAPVPPLPAASVEPADPMEAVDVAGVAAPPKQSPAKVKHAEPEVWDDWDEPAPTTRSRPRERRRMSLNDFVIPDSVLAKQKELKRGIGAVKKFAGGVDALKNLVESHDRVCNYILASGSQAETRLFVALENEYAQWWEMATVLIEVGSTGTDGASPNPEVNSRRVTLATEDARVASEALRHVSAASMNSFTTRTSTTSVTHDVFLVPNGSPRASPPPELGRTSTGRHDLSKRQLEVLRTMLRTPVQASDSVVPYVEQRQASSMTTRRAKHMSMPAVPVSSLPPPVPTPPRTLAAPRVPLGTPSPDATYIFPSPSYPSPNTASALAQPKKTGLAGLKEFLRALKTNRGGSATPSRPPRAKPPRKRPAPINLQAAESYQSSPPASPLTTAGITTSAEEYRNRTQLSGQSADGRSPKKETFTKKRRPSLKNIFRPTSGNWADLVRSTPPASPPPFVGENASGVPGKNGSVPATPTRGSPVLSKPGHHGEHKGTLQRPPSIPALARLKHGKQGSYASLGVEAGSSSNLAMASASPIASPTKSMRHRPSVGAMDAPGLPDGQASNPNGTVFPPQPSTPNTVPEATMSAPPPIPSPPVVDGDATLRLKSRIMGLGHPSEGSPGPRTASSPARPLVDATSLAPPVQDETPRSRSDYGPRGGAPDVIALTPENLPVLLDYVQQCERRLDEWRRRADRLGVSETPAVPA